MVTSVTSSLHQEDVRSNHTDLDIVIVQQEAAKDLFSETSHVFVALQSSESIYHEAGSFFPGQDEDSCFITSNILASGEHKTIQIHKLTRKNASPDQWTQTLIPDGDIHMGNGGVPTPQRDGTLFCSQGSRDDAGGLIWMSKDEPHSTKVVLRSFHGRRFNSVNDVVYAKDGSIWFTDPIYGHEQGFRGTPQLPSQLYRYDEKSNDLRVMADGFERPNGLCFSPDGETLYVTDTDWIHGDGTTSDSRVSHIYAFTVKVFGGSPFLTDRRLFAMADTGAPDGIKCDSKGNVWSGCGDGVNVWSAGGSLILKIIVQGGVANFCFGRPGEVLMLNEKRFVVARLNDSVVSA